MGTNAMSWNRLDGGKPPAWTYETNRVGGDRDWLAHSPEVADPYLVVATSGNASGGLAPRGCHAAREHSSSASGADATSSSWWPYRSAEMCAVAVIVVRT
jgi:hypothetical protein